MSVSCWVMKKFGALIALFYVVTAGVLVVTYYHTGVADADMVARYYPPGHYAGSDKYRTVWQIYGFTPTILQNRLTVPELDIVSYRGDDVTVRGESGVETMSVADVLKYVENRDSAEMERAFSPLYGPLETLLRIHLNFMNRVETAVGGDEGGYRRLLVPKAIVSCAYLGVVLIVYLILRRIDRPAGQGRYQGGYSTIYASLALWPLGVIAVSFGGMSVLDVARHLPDSYHFLHWYVVGGWAAIFAWPAFVTFLSILDILNATLRVGLNQAVAHAGVLALGLVSIPLVTVGVLFALLVATLYIGYRAVKRVVLPGKK